MRLLSSCAFRGEGAALRRSRIDPVGVEGKAGAPDLPFVTMSITIVILILMFFFLGCLQDASGRCLAIEPTADVLDRVLIEAGVKAARDVADVWRGQQVRQRAERMVERQRLPLKDIDGSTGDLPGFERGN